MKKYLFVLLILSLYIPAKAQQKLKDSIFTSPEVDAEFPGGVQSFSKFLGQNLIYPPSEVRTRTTGRVTVSFVVETNGQLSNLTLVKGISPNLDKEALRLIALSPRWNPAKQDKQKVRARYTFPVTFYLLALPVIHDGLDTIYAKADEPPKYPDGEDELMKFIKKNLRNPFSLMQDPIKGRAAVAFVVEKDGSLSHIDVVASPIKAMTDEAVRLIQLIPEKFIPAKQNGIAVRGQYMVLIPF